MKVAILHDYLNQFGGAERVLQAILEMFPDADLYTLLYDDEREELKVFGKNLKKTSFLDFPLVRKNHRFFIPLMPLAAKLLSSNEQYDLLISSSAGFGKGINVKGGYHVSYCHSPLRYAWEEGYLKSHPFLFWSFSKAVFLPVKILLRNWDKKASTTVNLFIANSSFTAGKIKKCYGRDSEIIYPPVDPEKFYYDSSQKSNKLTPYNFRNSTGLTKLKSKSYYLMVGRLLYYKGFEAAIRAFRRLEKPLKIIGRGPEEKRLRKTAKSPFIEFLGHVPDKRLRTFYSGAKALIFPQIEDFGLVAAEAQACGVPVIAYRVGGGAEIVTHGKTGLLFDKETPEGIMEAIKTFETMKFNRRKIAESAERFSKENFKNQFSEVLRKSGVMSY